MKFAVIKRQMGKGSRAEGLRNSSEMVGWEQVGGGVKDCRLASLSKPDQRKYLGFVTLLHCIVCNEQFSSFGCCKVEHDCVLVKNVVIKAGGV